MFLGVEMGFRLFSDTCEWLGVSLTPCLLMMIREQANQNSVKAQTIMWIIFSKSVNTNDASPSQNIKLHYQEAVDYTFYRT